MGSDAAEDSDGAENGSLECQYLNGIVNLHEGRGIRSHNIECGPTYDTRTSQKLNFQSRRMEWFV